MSQWHVPGTWGFHVPAVHREGRAEHPPSGWDKALAQNLAGCVEEDTTFSCRK